MDEFVADLERIRKQLKEVFFFARSPYYGGWLNCLG